MRTLTRQELQKATTSHDELESVVIHATGMRLEFIKTGLGCDKIIESDIRYYLLNEIEGMPLKMRQELFQRTYALC